FPGANGETFPALEEVNLLPQHPPSARERRRLRQRALKSAEEVPPVQTPLLQPDSFSLHSNFSLDVDQVKGKNEERLHKLTELQQKSPSLGDDISLGDVDDLLQRAESHASSAESAATEAWLRPGTAAALRSRLQQRPRSAQPGPQPPLGRPGLSTAHG
ncbi:CSPP1 protein, partial [Spelaeornis formosus]|nr:CSPP1 protein [Elachura formosa]